LSPYDSSTTFLPFLLIVLVTSFLILLRTVFRLAESAQGEFGKWLSLFLMWKLIVAPGFFGFASTHEDLFGSLEYAPVILALAIWSVLPPSRFLTNTQIKADLGGIEGKRNIG